MICPECHSSDIDVRNSTETITYCVCNECENCFKVNKQTNK